MKLDRNQNPDGCGKYALVNMRRLREKPEFQPLVDELAEHGIITLGSEAPDNQFFVMKYKDIFTEGGIRGYREAIGERVKQLQTLAEHAPSEVLDREIADLLEFSGQLEGEEFYARRYSSKTPD